MIDLFKVCLVPYDDEAISLDALLTFAEAHLPLVINDPVAAQVTMELTGVSNALDALGVTVSDETVKLGLQKARISAKNVFRAGLPNQVSRIYGAALEAYGQQGTELETIFPEGREIFSSAKDAMLGAKLAALHTAVAAHSAALGAPMVTLALALKNDWQTVFQAAVDAKGVKGGSATARREDVRDLKTALGLLLLELGKQLLRQEERMRSLLPQHLLGQPVEGGGEDEGETPEPPAPPTGLTFAQENPGDAVTVDGTLAPGVTLLTIFAKLVGSSDEPAQVGAAATLPMAITMSPGDYEFTATVTTAAGESAPSAPVTLTVA